MSIYQILANQAKLYPHKIAFINKEQTVTFSELFANALCLAQYLRNLGISKSDKVAFYLPNSFDYVYSYLACFILGAVGVPLDFMLKSDELISCLNHSEAKILIAKNNNLVDLDDIRSKVKSLKDIVTTGGNESPHLPLMHRVSMVDTKGFRPQEVDDKDPALIMYTSGTTGKPKGILLNYKHLEGSPLAMKHFVDLTDKDVKIAAIPFSHIGGFIYIQNCIHFAITTILMERFNPYEFLALVAQWKVTCFHIVPPMYNAILTLKQIENFDLSALRWVVVFGAPSSPEIMERFHKYCPNAKLLNGWGMTETCPPNTVTPLGSSNIKSVGKPAPYCKIKVVDEKGNEVKAGEIGELILSGWIVMDGYYKDPEGTAEVLRNGWLYTGDLAKVDEEGFLYIVGRKKDMIKVGGQIVYAPEVEAALYKHEAVSEVAVIGMSDKLRGEVVKAFVVLKNGAAVTAEELRYFTKDHLANFKVPQTIELRDSLPKNRTGKIDKESLKQESGSFSDVN